MHALSVVGPVGAVILDDTQRIDPGILESKLPRNREEVLMASRQMTPWYTIAMPV
jgi:hypothetical protein